MSLSSSFRSTLQINSGSGKKLFFFFFLLSGRGEVGVDVGRGVEVPGRVGTEPKEEADGEGDETREGEEGRLLV